MQPVTKTTWLHGWGFNNHVFDSIASHDLFHAPRLPCLYDISIQVQDSAWESIINKLVEDLEPGTVLIGWSMGGLLAINMAATSDKVEKLVLLGSAPRLVNDDSWKHTIPVKEFDVLGAGFKHSPRKVLDNMVALTAYGDTDTRATAKKLRNYSADFSYIEILESWLEQISTADLRACLNDLDKPVLMILGENDALLKPRLLDQVETARLSTCVIPACGHAPFLNHSDEIITAINRFMTSHDD